MDIIFQSGEFYNNSSDVVNLLGNFLGALTGAVLSGLIAIWIFKRGIKQEAVKEKEKDLERIERNRKTFFTLLESIISTLKKQINEYTIYIEKVKANPLSNVAPKELTFQNLERILKFESFDIIELYDFLKFSTQDYLKTINNLDYINAVIKKVPEDLWSIKGNNIQNLSTNCIQVKNEILNLCADYLRENKAQNSNYESDNLWQFLNEMVLGYYKDNDGNPDLRYDYEKLIKPLKEVLLKDFPFHPTSVEILKKTKICGDIIFTIKGYNSGFARDLAAVINHLNESVSDLENLK